MDRDQLRAKFRELGCEPTDGDGHSYSTRLLLCGCGRHSLAAVVCEGVTDTVKLLGPAVSWAIAKRGGTPLRYVVGKDDENKWPRAVAALQLATRGVSLKIEIEADFEPVEPLVVRDLAGPDWAQLLRERGSLPKLGGLLWDQAALASFTWYHPASGGWSGRIDGLQVCQLDSRGERLAFSVGSEVMQTDGMARERSRVRSAFLKVSGDVDPVVFTEDRVSAAAEFLTSLAKAVANLGSEEHRLEARVLRGEVPLVAQGRTIKPVDPEHPFQLPARWALDDARRSVDVLARDGRTPWVVELKVDRGQGAYYVEGIVQAALYREFVRSAASLHPWFDERKMDAARCEALLVHPKLKGTDERVRELRTALAAVAAAFHVERQELLEG